MPEIQNDPHWHQAGGGGGHRDPQLKIRGKTLCNVCCIQQPRFKQSAYRWPNQLWIGSFLPQWIKSRNKQEKNTPVLNPIKCSCPYAQKLLLPVQELLLAWAAQLCLSLYRLKQLCAHYTGPVVPVRCGLRKCFVEIWFWRHWSIFFQAVVLVSSDFRTNVKIVNGTLWIKTPLLC